MPNAEVQLIDKLVGVSSRKKVLARSRQETTDILQSPQLQSDSVGCATDGVEHSS